MHRALGEVNLWMRISNREVTMVARYLKLGLSEHELREALESELILAMRAEGDVPTLHAIAHAVARAIGLNDLRIAEQLEAAGVSLSQTADPAA
jgi:hypothetical protein